MLCSMRDEARGTRDARRMDDFTSGHSDTYGFLLAGCGWLFYAPRKLIKIRAIMMNRGFGSWLWCLFFFMGLSALTLRGEERDDGTAFSVDYLACYAVNKHTRCVYSRSFECDCGIIGGTLVVNPPPWVVEWFPPHICSARQIMKIDQCSVGVFLVVFAYFSISFHQEWAESLRCL